MELSGYAFFRLYPLSIVYPGTDQVADAICRKKLLLELGNITRLDRCV